MKKIFNWLQNTFSSRQRRNRPNLGQSDNHLRNTIRDGKVATSKSKQDTGRSQPEYVDMDPGNLDAITHGRVENKGPGKNVYARSKFVREETGTHDTLKIIDESLVDGDDDGEAGLDPYNTGQFDRSKNWDSRFRK